jgi:hypothetical protein
MGLANQATESSRIRRGILTGRGLRARLPGLSRFWDIHLSRKSIARIRVDGLTLYLHRQDEGIASSILAGAPYEEEERAFLGRFLQAGMTFIDIGAHAGLYACLAARLVGERGRVVAFEPESLNCHLLRRSLAANGLGNVRVERLAVSDRSGKAWLERSYINHGAHHVIQAPTPHWRKDSSSFS